MTDNISQVALSLPQELLERISSHLDSTGFFNLRLAGKDLEDKTFHVFSMRFFTRKAIHFTSDSIGSLQDMSASPRIMPYIKEIYISVKCLHQRMGEYKDDADTYVAFQTMSKDQRDLEVTEMDFNRLVSVFKQLEKLRQIGFISAPEDVPELDYRGLSRLKAVLGGYCGSVGVIKDRLCYREHIQHCFATVIRALVESGAPIVKLSTNVSEKISVLRDELDGFPIRNDDTFWQQSLPSIETVDLQIGDGQHEGMFKRLAGMLPNVRHLSIHQGRGHTSENIVMAFLNNQMAARIQSLHLSGSEGSAKLLIARIHQMENIKVFKLETMELSISDWYDLLKALMGKINTLEHVHIIFPIGDEEWLGLLPERVKKSVGEVDMGGVEATGDQQTASSNNRLTTHNQHENDEAAALITSGVPQSSLSRPSDTMTTTAHSDDDMPEPPQYHEDFVRPLWKRCDERVRFSGGAGPTEEPVRGSFVCLRTPAEIKEYLPQFTAHMRAQAGEVD